ncbi:helix-turn-helix transcriptional regulator [Fusibacter ferrireducens]|uniref:PAS domain-containing protein n=1 Tax=Fusibacter ferrireducens TaxID=2785058 RepID=A0ABR9ZW62_9FIRM|nr:PAS domain-containing protein [Fusibacter ferrireducens]MBF4694679.1 PAS domain-containing protein [Fusibacter ferrireducens]
MTQIETVISILDFFSKVMGDETEIVVHDLIHNRIKWISNGHITGRSQNDIDDPTTMHIARRHAMDSPLGDMLIGGSSYTKGTTHIRSSTFFLKDPSGKSQYAICVNQDLTHIDAMQKYLEHFTGTSLETIESTSKVDDSIETLTKQLIFSEIEREKPFSSDSREAKLAIIQRLEDKGVFEVKGSIPIVCEFLQIAQATLYKYLKEIKQSKCLEVDDPNFERELS